MNHLALVRIFSLIGIYLSGVILACALVAFAVGQQDQAWVFVGAAAASGPLGATILLLTGKPRQKSRAVDGLALAVLFWIFVPIFGAIPFLPAVETGGFLTAYYEAVSCLTTTGHSVLTSDLSSSLMLWRAALHIVGAVGAMTIAATVLSALNLGGPGIHRSRFFTIPEGSFFDALPRVIRLSFTIIALTILILTALLIVTGIDPDDAFLGAVSAATTGLVDPDSHTVPPENAFAIVILSLGLVSGMLGLIVIDHLSQREYTKAANDPEVVAMSGSLVGIAFLAFLAGVPIFSAFGWAVSSLSTSGIALADPLRLERIPLVLALFPVLIGGSALSAAGGVKLGRLIVLSKRVTLEFTQLGYRGSVQTFTFRGRRQSEETVMGVWVYLVGYIIAAVVGILLLSLIGQPFPYAIRTAIGSLTNAGHILAGAGELTNPALQIGAILGMILGRIEVIALVPALSPSFWQR
ncbi:MAG: hypothetical protein AAFO63_09480 [Pseudomonadota bacterium]